MFIETYETGISCFQGISDTNPNIHQNQKDCLESASQTKASFIDFIPSDKKGVFSDHFTQSYQCQENDILCYYASYGNILNTCHQEKETVEQSQIMTRICSISFMLLKCIENSADEESSSQCINIHTKKINRFNPFCSQRKI